MLQTTIDHNRLTYGRKPQARNIEDIVRIHGQLVRRVAWHVHSRMSTAIDVEDLIQIGMIALVEAARTFEDRGISFVPYATTRVRGAMIDELRRDARMARAGMARRRELANARGRLENQLLRRATDTEMAAEMGLSADEYHAAVASTQALKHESIEEAYSDHDPLFADDHALADCFLESQEQKQILSNCIAQLSEREAMVIQLYFVEELNLEEIGSALGVGAARACQIKRSAIGKLNSLISKLL